jgi:hypothetical protein
MADEQSAGEGTQEAGASEESAPAKPMTRAEKDAADRAAFLSGEWDDEAPGEKSEKKSEAKTAKKADAKKAEEVEASSDDEEDVDEDDDIDLDDDEDDDEGDAEDDDDDKQVAKDADPELAKRLAKVQRYEKRVRDQMDAREKQFVRERDAFVAEWKPKVEAYEQFEKLKGKRSDPAGVLKSLGYSEDDFADVSKILWALSKEGGADPKNRDAVARMRDMREMREQVEAANKRAEALEQRLSKADEQADVSRRAEQYMGKVTKAIGDETPLAKKRLEVSPKKAHLELTKVAIALAQKTGESADPRSVVRAYEKKLTRMLESVSALRGDEKPAASAKKKPTIEVVDKSKAKAAATTEAPKNGAGKTLFPDRQDMIERLHKIERGEIDPNTD